MATRFYLPVAGTAPTAPPVRSDWERSIAAFARRPLVRTKSNSALTDFAALMGSTATSQTCWYQWVSEPLVGDQAISGTISMVVRGLEAAIAEDAHLAFVARVMQGDSTTLERGVLLVQHTTATEFTTSAQTRIHSALAISTVNALHGDRIVIEIGIHAVTAGNAANITLRFGDPSGTADFALTSGLTTDLCPWVELSSTLAFEYTLTGGVAAPAPSLSGTAAETFTVTGGLAAPAPSLAGTATHTLPGAWDPPAGLKIWEIAPSAGDEVLIPSITTGPGADVEIVAVVQKTDATVGTDFSRYVYGQTTSGEFESALSHHESTDATHWHAVAGKATVDSVRATSGETIALDTPTLLRARWDGTADTVTISVDDGTPVSTGYNANVQSATAVTGAWTVFASGLPIIVEEVLVWNRLLTTPEWEDVRDHLSATAIDLSGGVTAPGPSLAGTLAETFTTTGGVTAPGPSLAGTLAETFTTSGGITAPGPSLAGTLAETFTVAGGVTAPAPSFTGTVATYGVTGGITAPAPSLGGTLAETFTVAGGVTAPAPSLTGTVTSTPPETAFAGGITAPAPSLAGTLATEVEEITFSGGVTAPGPSLAGAMQTTLRGLQQGRAGTASVTSSRAGTSSGGKRWTQ